MRVSFQNTLIQYITYQSELLADGFRIRSPPMSPCQSYSGQGNHSITLVGEFTSFHHLVRQSQRLNLSNIDRGLLFNIMTRSTRSTIWQVHYSRACRNDPVSIPHLAALRRATCVSSGRRWQKHRNIRTKSVFRSCPEYMILTTVYPVKSYNRGQMLRLTCSLVSGKCRLGAASKLHLSLSAQR